MKLRKFAVTSALVIAGMGVATGTSFAAPAGVQGAEIAKNINYTVNRVDNSAVVNTDGGSLSIADGQLEVKSAAGDVVAAAPLSYHLNDKVFPIDASVAGNTATLTPVTDASRAVPAAPLTSPQNIAAGFAATDVAAKSPAEIEKGAFGLAKDQIGLGASVGAIVGGVLAGGVGCVVGGAVAAPTAVLTAVFGPLAGCVAGALVMAPVGALGGIILVAAPVAVAAGIQYFNTVTAPPAPAA